MNEDEYLNSELRNYYNDKRVRAKRAWPPTDATPFEWIVCDLCDGRGTVVNPLIDANGLTASDFDEDPDFRDNYLRGDYDITCPRCAGRTTIPFPEAKKTTPEVED